MAQARRKKGTAAKLTHQVTRGLREGALLILGALAIFLLVSLASYHPADPGWSSSGAVSRGVAVGVGGARQADGPVDAQHQLLALEKAEQLALLVGHRLVQQRRR